jgi:hypothetical protein
LIRLDLPDAFAPYTTAVLRAEVPFIDLDLWCDFRVPLHGIRENTSRSLNDKKFSTVNLINIVFCLFHANVVKKSHFVCVFSFKVGI